MQVLKRASLFLVVLAGGYAAFRYFARIQYRHSLHGAPDGTPANLAPGFEDVKIESTDGLTLDARWIPDRGSSRVVVLAPGRSGTKTSVYLVRAARIYADAGFNVLMLSLRSQGDSQGRLRTAGYQEVRDVHGALRWLKERGFEPKNVVLHGFSSGAAAMVMAAPGTGVGAVVEESSFAGLPLLLGSKLPGHRGPSNFLSRVAYLTARLLGVEFDPWTLKPSDAAARLYEEGVPLLIIHSRDDGIVPFEHAELMVAAHPGATLWGPGGEDHAAAYKDPEYPERLRDFIGKTVGIHGGA